MTEHSADYHDYVFRDGNLVGDFESMYRYSSAVPWHQDEQANWVDVRLTMEMLRDLGPFAEIHDLGCGLGYYLSLLRNRVGAVECAAFGYDISATACEKASALFPAFQFRTLDLTQSASGEPAHAAARPSGRRLFVIRGTLWYVFPQLAQVVRTARRMTTGGDTLLVVQNFPPIDKPFVGKDVIPDQAALIRHFSEAFVPVRHLWYQDALKTANDNWFIGLFSPRHP